MQGNGANKKKAHPPGCRMKRKIVFRLPLLLGNTLYPSKRKTAAGQKYSTRSINSINSARCSIHSAGAFSITSEYVEPNMAIKVLSKATERTRVRTTNRTRMKVAKTSLRGT